MERSVQLVHPDILTQVALYLPLSSRLQLAATCRSMISRVVFKHGNSQLENLPSNVLNKIMWYLSSQSDRLRLGAASWTLRMWAIQNRRLTLHFWAIHLKEDCFEFRGKYDKVVGVLPFRDSDLLRKVTAMTFILKTDFSGAHIDQSIHRLSAFRRPVPPVHIDLIYSNTLNGQSDDPTAVRRLVEYLGGTSKPFGMLRCYTRHNETLLLESDFLHRVQARIIRFDVGDIGPDGLDFTVEDSVQEGVQLRKEYPRVYIRLDEQENQTSSPPIVFNSLLRFIRAHFSSTPGVRFKYDVALTCWGDDCSSAIRTLVKECGVRPETHRDEKKETLQFKTSSDPARRIVSRLHLNTARHDIFVGAGRVPWQWLIM